MPRTTPDFLALDWNGTVVPFFGRPAFPDALDVLRQFRQEGLSLFVVSHATQQQIADDVERIGFAFDGVIGCYDKAAPLSELRAQHGLGAFVGDHPSDFRAAQEAGVPFIQACLEGQSLIAGCQESIHAWTELPQLLLAASGSDG